MADFHRNIFSYFRGASQPEHDREQQIEDNTTKALVNTLEHCSPDVVIRFLQWLGISDPGNVIFEQQRITIGDERIRHKPHRLLLAIVGTKNPLNQSVCDQLPVTTVGDSRPDAWLYGDNFVVLIESKTGESTLDLNQMACHWNKLWGGSLRSERKDVRVVTWAEVHEFFLDLMRGLGDAKSKWLAEQFTQYLEWTGMTDFVGFKEEMFEFFVASERDPDMKKWVRDAVAGLGDKVLFGKDGLQKFDDFYSHKHIGNLAKESDHYWVAFGPEKSFRNWAHQTISLYEQKLDVFVNVELMPPIRRLRKKIKAGGFREVMCDLPAPFTVFIEERKPTKQPRVFGYFPVASVETVIYENCRYGLADAHSTGFEYIERLLFDIEYPYISVRRSIDRKEVVELSESNGKPLVAEVLDTLKGFHPLVKYIND